MKAVILAGGLGTRLAEETTVKPKPLVEIGGAPILWHIMKLYSYYQVNNFVICLGYKGEMIREYFVNYMSHRSDITVDMENNIVEIHKKRSEKWRVTLVDTGQETMTGGRIKAVLPYVENEESFFMTYGDGVGDVDITRLLEFHKSHGREATVTAVTPPGRFGVLDIDESQSVSGFREKVVSDQYKVNAGFFVLSPSIGDRIEGSDTVFEQGPMESLAANAQLCAFNHDGFWQPMDTLRDKQLLERLWVKRKAPWAVWDK